MDSVAAGRFPRPLTLAVTSIDQALMEGDSGRAERSVLSGPYWEFRAAAEPTAIDTARVRLSFATLDGAAARGMYMSPSDRSPINRSYSEQMHDIVAGVAGAYVRAVARGGNPERTRKAMEWAVAQARSAGASAEAIERIRSAARDSADVRRD
jgi:hypothetical protein